MVSQAASAPPEPIPISYLNALEYCPRRFYYEFVLGEMIVNEHVLEGRQRHQIADQPGAEREGDRLIVRRLPVYSERLGLTGLVDVVEAAEPADGPARLTPVEYKKGRMSRWLNDHVQLCAQALCLEESTGQVIPHGYIFYFGSRRRDLVAFTPALRQRTEAAVARAHALAAAGRIPPPISQRSKCRDCSLQPLCLPDEVTTLSASSAPEGDGAEDGAWHGA